MPITLIRDDEQHTTTACDATFTYRRMPSHVQQRIEHKHTKRGQTDVRLVVEDVLAYCIRDWSGVNDAHGQPVPYEPSLLKYLPEEAKSKLLEQLYASEPEDATKN